MASYASDSDSDDGSYQTTNVLLGYANPEPTEDTISIIGGHPAWLSPGIPPSAALARCKVCHDMMAQLLQLHGDLPERFAGHERRLHVFACRRRTCKRKVGSVRALRSARATKATEPLASASLSAAPLASTPAPQTAPQARPPQNLGGSIFGGGRGGTLFGAPPKPPAVAPAPSPSPTADLASSFADKARIAPDPSLSSSALHVHGPIAAPEPWPSQESLAKAYTQYYLDADYEELDSSGNEIDGLGANTSIAALAVEESTGNTSAEDAGGSTADMFESLHDRTFQRFADRLAQNPEQVLRYEFGGTPLLYAKDDSVGRQLAVAASATSGIPSCPRCLSPRVFEVQLVPHLISELEADEEPAAALEGMEWATIIVGVCARDCAGALGECVHVEEWVGVQWEEEQQQQQQQE